MGGNVVTRRQIHPFPARMAPELALDALQAVRRGSVVLDPMCGSGTVLKHAVELGHHSIGVDSDPLAVLLSRSGARRIRAGKIVDAAERLIDTCGPRSHPPLPWIDRDPETQAFTEFWFAPSQRLQLRRLAAALYDRRGPIADLLRVAVSRTIITKDVGASLARDVSHSRPHRVREDNDYDVFHGFLKAATQIARVVDRPTPGTATVFRGDARALPARLKGAVDLVVTSPPYLNAIDYMRGHRLSLVWLGHTLAELRDIRGNSIGAERHAEAIGASIRRLVPRLSMLTPRDQGMLSRYVQDVDRFMTQVSKALTETGEAVVVVGDNTLRGVYIENSSIIESAASRAGLRVTSRASRLLPSRSRYLPPPAEDDNPLSRRMRSETVFRLAKRRNV